MTELHRALLDACELIEQIVYCPEADDHQRLASLRTALTALLVMIDEET